MNKFFVSDEIYEERLAICRECVYYFKPTGNCKRCLCFMKLKARLAPMSCPQSYWLKTTEVTAPDDLPQHLIDEVLDIWKDLKTGRAKNIVVLVYQLVLMELKNYIINTMNKKTYKSIKSVLRFHIKKNVKSLWTWDKSDGENFTCIYENYSGDDRIYTSQQLLKLLEK